MAFCSACDEFTVAPGGSCAGLPCVVLAGVVAAAGAGTLLALAGTAAIGSLARLVAPPRSVASDQVS